ncbi:MAG: GUN4 domain-containing protein, partial [Okeania sp. SIO2D1]|nr:GUN4 domain-containing protein [Okeania sp. SIO2D1]
MEQKSNNLLFANLDNYLEQQQWQCANEETEQILLKMSEDGLETDFIDLDDIEKMSVENFKTLDQLWLKYSNNHFGFSIHKEIICFDRLNQEKFNWTPAIINKLGDNVGWRKEGVWLNYPSQYTFNIHAPLGHLPTFWAIDT